MSCPKTQLLLKEYFSDELSLIAKNEIEAHVSSCEFCNAEFSELLETRKTLEGWQHQIVPHWDRGEELFRRENGNTNRVFSFWDKLQWLPTGASAVMLILFLLNTELSSSQDGYNISFGSPDVSVVYLENELSAFEESQRANLEQAIQQIEAREDSNNVELLRAALYQNQQDTAANLERIYALFDQQRIRDLEDMRAGYQQLMDSDYETLRSLRQLAQIVSYQEQGL